MNRAATNALPARFRFASGDGASASDELAATLQARLRVITAAGVVANVAVALISLVRLRALSGEAFASMQTGLIANVVLLLPQIVALWWLRQSRPRTLRTLRWLETGFLVAVSTVFALLLLNDFPSIVPVLDVAPMDLGYSQAVWMSGMIVAYGLVIPNRWQRTAGMIAFILGIVVVVDVRCFTRYDIAGPVAATYLAAQWTVLMFFTLITMFGAYRIEAATTVARDALKLGQYVLVERLGAGGMGEVHKAEHRLLRRPCAIKLIRAEHAGNADVLRRFEREVQATAALTHPNTIAIYDYGISDDGTFYYVMEYLPGDTLEQLVARDGPMHAPRAIHVLRQIAGALHEAHGAGLTHRDIKPGNVMLGERGGVSDVAKLLDFGLVTAPNTAGDAGDGALSGITQVGTILGTPAYMSPEQCAGEQQPGPASDLYSLGALGYFLVTGRAPFEGRAPLQMMLAHLSEAPPSARLLRPELSPDFDALLQRCLAKRPEDRFASALELERALRGVGA